MRAVVSVGVGVGLVLVGPVAIAEPRPGHRQVDAPGAIPPSGKRRRTRGRAAVLSTETWAPGLTGLADASPIPRPALSRSWWLVASSRSGARPPPGSSRNAGRRAGRVPLRKAGSPPRSPGTCRCCKGSVGKRTSTSSWSSRAGPTSASKPTDMVATEGRLGRGSLQSVLSCVAGPLGMVLAREVRGHGTG